MVRDKGEDIAFCLEVNAMAFFKRSCSICRRSYLRFTSRSSFSSALIAWSNSIPFGHD